MKLLLPVDGTPAALAAVRHALQLRARGLDATFVLVNVQPPPTLYEVVTAPDADRLSELRRSAGADLLAAAEALLDAAGAEWESEVAGGAAVHVLVDLIDAYGCDAVVVGCAGALAGNATAIGDVAMALLQHSPVPVTLVREHAPQPDGADADAAPSTSSATAADDASLPAATDPTA